MFKLYQCNEIYEIVAFVCMSAKTNLKHQNLE